LSISATLWAGKGKQEKMAGSYQSGIAGVGNVGMHDPR